MSTFKKTKVIMLPTNEKANVYLNKYADNKNKADKLVFGGNIKGELTSSIKELEDRGYKSQNLYFLSDEEINDGDWYYWSVTNTIQKAIKDSLGRLPKIEDGSKKIIATTDKSLEVVSKGINPVYEKLPQPSTLFIEKFVEEYNKGNVITEVMVEYEEGKYNLDELRERHLKGLPHSYDYCNLKINPKDNTITIRKIKDSWSREEVKQLFDEWNDIVYKGFYVGKKDLETVLDYSDKWIEENL